DLQIRVRDHVGVLRLELMVDEGEGYAYLRQRSVQVDERELPRLVPRRQLGYAASLLLVLLRKKLSEFDAQSSESRLILTRDAIADMLRIFLAETSNEARLLDRIDRIVIQIEEMGFVQRLRGSDDRFEVRRILKAFVDAQWLSDLERLL